MKLRTLVQNYKKNNPDGCFFNPSWLAFFGEDFDTMHISDEKVLFKNRECYELITYQRNSPREDKTGIYYFDCENFDYIGCPDRKR